MRLTPPVRRRVRVPVDETIVETPAAADPRQEELEVALAAVAEEAGSLSVELVDVAGNVDDVTTRFADQASTLEQLAAAADEIRGHNGRVAETAAAVGERARAAGVEVDASRARVDGALEDVRGLVDAVERVADRLDDLAETVVGVRGIAATIDDIAKQTHLLALNARIEAARSGGEGSGFAVIAEEVRKLSDRTIESAGQADEMLRGLATHVAELVEQSRASSASAETVGESTQSIGGVVEQLSAAMADVGGGAEEIAGAASETDREVVGFRDALATLTAGVGGSSESLREARDRVNRLLAGSERLLQKTVGSGVETVDAPFVRAVVETAARIGALFEQALDDGTLSEAELWDVAYVPVEGTNPQQLTTRYVAFTDRVLPPIQEPLLDLDEHVAFCAAVDRNGYLPTHNAKFSRPQGRDPVWNAANCRNRRLFDDRTGLACGRNLEPFLLQTYRRDMGGTYVLMKDVSAPIHVRGRHWGGFRMGYRA